MAVVIPPEKEIGKLFIRDHHCHLKVMVSKLVIVLNRPIDSLKYQMGQQASNKLVAQFSDIEVMTRHMLYAAHQLKAKS